MPALPAERSSPDRAVKRRRQRFAGCSTTRRRVKATSLQRCWPRFRTFATHRVWRAPDWPWH